MKILVTASIICFLVFGCNTKKKPTLPIENVPIIAGEWDNFLQYWQENTADSIHRIDTDQKHRHFSLRIDSSKNNSYTIEIREGRNGKTLVEKMELSSLEMTTGGFTFKGDTLFVTGHKYFENKDAYRFVRTRKFSGWIEYPLTIFKDSTYHQGNLEIHDQGGMVTLDIEGVDYTVELTQLVFAKKLGIMKLAIYDLPLDSVGINSRSISYTWVNPGAKRIGINLRKVISGWTFIEPGFQNQNSWKKEEK